LERAKGVSGIVWDNVQPPETRLSLPKDMPRLVWIGHVKDHESNGVVREIG
jgi:hypothetical protein